MRKAKSLLGLKVISQVQGSQLGTVKDLILDAESTRVLALLLSDRDLFGLIDAVVVPYEAVRDIGPHAVMVANDDVVIKAHSDPAIARAFDQNTKVEGKRIATLGGEQLGSVADIHLDDRGYVAGYDISSGLLADAFGGKKFLPLPSSVTVGKDVILVPQSAADELRTQKAVDSGSPAAAVQNTAHEVTGAITSRVSNLLGQTRQEVVNSVESVRSDLSETYNSLANSTVEKQRQFLVGKTAYRDVVVPASRVAEIDNLPSTTAAVEDGSADASTGTTASEVDRPTVATATDVNSDGEVIQGRVLVRRNTTITEADVDGAMKYGIVHELIAAALGGVAGQAIHTGRKTAVDAVKHPEQTVSGLATAAQAKLEKAALGKPAASEVIAPDGSVIVAPGMIITPEILATADLHGRKADVIATAGAGAVAQTAREGWQATQKTAESLWDQMRAKTSELTQRAQAKRTEAELKEEQARIDAALGLPVNRIILDREDNIILSQGDIVTNAAVARAREAGMLEALLRSVVVESASAPPAAPAADAVTIPVTEPGPIVWEINEDGSSTPRNDTGDGATPTTVGTIQSAPASDAGETSSASPESQGVTRIPLS